MSARLLLLLPAVLLCQCSLTKHRQQPESPANPVQPRRGWALMLTDEQLAAGGQAPAGSTVPGPPEGGAPSTGGLFDFSGMISSVGAPASRTQVSWQVSVTEAARLARSSGKPLLIYMTHRSSKPAQEIEATLMLTPEFTELVQASFIALRVDFSNQDTNRSPVYRDLKQRFNVHGYPFIVVTLPDGSEVKRLAGYKPDHSAGHLATLRNAVTSAEQLATTRRTKLQTEGYRMWRNKDGRPVLAKLTALDANMGSFTGEWGDTFKTFLTRLSEEDQQWIAERRR